MMMTIIIIIIITIISYQGILKLRNYRRKPYQYNRLNTETNDMSTMNSNNRIGATLYSLGT